jgi:hypothetical protein
MKVAESILKSKKIFDYPRNAGYIGLKTFKIGFFGIGQGRLGALTQGAPCFLIDH